MLKQPIATLKLPEYKIKDISSKGYTYCEDVDEKALEEIGMSEETWKNLTKKSETKTALDILQEEYYSSNIVTFSKELDESLGGGVPTKLITEFTGQSGSGKTQICMQLCASVQLPVCFGGIAGHAVYIDTSLGFTKDRFEEIANGCIRHCSLVAEKYDSFEMMTSLRNISARTLLDGVHYLRATKFLELLASVNLLRGLLNHNNMIKLLVIDSITKPFKECDLEYFERTKIFYTLLSDFQQMAQSYNFAIVLTNDMTTKFDVQGGSYIAPSLGDSYAHRINTRISLRRIADNKFSAFLDKSVFKPPSEVFFKITGPAEATLIRAEDCPGLENLDIKLPITIHKINRTKQVIDVNLTLPFDFGKNLELQISAAKWGDGGWKENAFELKDRKGCNIFNLIVGKMWYEIEEKVGIEPKVCPIKKGFYQGADIALDINKMRVRTFMYGKFRSIIRVSTLNKLVLCKVFEVVLDDKLSRN